MARKMQSRTKTAAVVRPTPVSNIGNEGPEVDAIRQEAAEVKRLWDRAETVISQGDAKAIHVIVRAESVGLFDPSISPRNWHRLESRQEKTEMLDRLLSDLFQIEKPTSADRQRLHRIRLVVPALIKAGGLDVFNLSDKGNIQLSTKTEYFAFCAKVEGEGYFAQSVAALDRGAKKYLAEEMPKRGAATGQGATANKMLGKASVFEVANTLENTLSKTPADKLTRGEKTALEHLLVQLLAIFATSEDGEHIDANKIEEIYQKEAA